MVACLSGLVLSLTQKTEASGLDPLRYGQSETVRLGGIQGRSYKMVNHPNRKKTYPDHTLEDAARKAGAPVCVLWETRGPKGTPVDWMVGYVIGNSTVSPRPTHRAPLNCPPSLDGTRLGGLDGNTVLAKLDASDILDGIYTPNSKNGRLRQEAIDVAGYIEHIGNAQ